MVNNSLHVCIISIACCPDHVRILDIGIALQWATKVLRHLAVKFNFRASWKHSPPFPPTNMLLIILFLRQHRPIGTQGNTIIYS